MKWVTRRFVHVDRTATAWLIKKFIDKGAEFVFIDYPREQPKPEHGTPFDIKGVELGHKNGKCTFEVVMEKYKVEDLFVKKVAEVVHAADIEGELHKVPEAAGILALFTGLRLIAKNDLEALEIGFKVWDSLYAYFKAQEIKEKFKDKLKELDRIARIEFLRSQLAST
ncbi:MAG: chromate resistance protein ChrB domain-containing protein [Candidatus Baldrarchaeia archaeon]